MLILKTRLVGCLVIMMTVVTVSGCVDAVAPGPSVSPSVSTPAVSVPEASLRWAKTLGGNSWDVSNSVAIAPNGDIIAVGWTTSTDGDFPAKIHPEAGSAVVVRFASDGTTVWARTYGGELGAEFVSVAVSGDGSILVAGFVSPNGDFGSVPYGQAVVKLDADGRIIWCKSIPPSLFGVYDTVTLASVVTTSDGVFLSGKTSIWDRSQPGIVYVYAGIVLRLDLDGNLVWYRVYDVDSQDSFSSVAVDEQSDVIVAGSTAPGLGTQDDRGNPDGLVVEYDGFGHELWAKTYGGSGIDEFTALALGSDNQIVVAGMTTSTDGDFPHQPGDDNWIGGVMAGITADGELDWTITYADQQFISLGSASDGSLVVSGLVFSKPSSDYGSTPWDHGPVVLKTTPSGAVVWSASLSATPVYFASVAVAADGAAIAVGNSDLATGAMACPVYNAESCVVIAGFDD